MVFDNIDNKPERVNPDSPSESENLTSAALSEYDCDSKWEVSGDETGSEDSDSKTRGTHKLPVMNLEFQLDAAKVGEYCDIHPIDPAFNSVA